MSRTKNAFKDWKEIRRKRALEMNEQGWKQCQIAEALGVSRAAVSQWISLSKTDAEGWIASIVVHYRDYFNYHFRSEALEEADPSRIR